MGASNIKFILAILLLLGLTLDRPAMVDAERSFVIDYDNNQFLKDSQPFRYVSGSIHYYRVHPSDWADRLRKMRMAGFNALQTYVEWASHEPEPGMYQFTGGLDLEAFITTAQREDLLVILRLGPYIDAERDMGGTLLATNKNPNMRFRSSDPSRERVWQLPACDYTYTGHMRDLVRGVLGDKAVLFTTDGGSVGYLKCGKIPGIYSTVDFGVGDPTPHFKAQRLFEPRGPLVNSEYYSGWLDHWGESHNTVKAEKLAKYLDQMLAMNASVNMYMFHGGTSFGLTAGSNKGSKFQACPTSYDYDAPLSEAGDPTEKYWIIRNITKKYLPLPSGDVPPASSKFGYGKVQVSSVGGVTQLTQRLSSVSSKWPLTFEELSVSNGLVSYETVIPFRIPYPARLSINDVHDRGYVYVDSVYAGTVDREQELFDLPIYAQPNATLAIIVESQGRICFGSSLNDFKGLTTNATVNGHQLSGWTMIPVPLTHPARLAQALSLISPQDLPLQGTGRMSFFKGQFEVPSESSHPRDTFLRLDGWSKGIVWVNDFMLGRYWPEVGPQVTLYVPHGVLQQGTNSLLLLEFEAAPCLTRNTCYVTLTDQHVIDGPTPL